MLARLLFTIFCMLAAANTMAARPMMPTKNDAWNGFYISGLFGQGWNRADWEFTNENYYNTLGTDLLGLKFHFKDSGGMAGGALGYNIQNCHLLLGIEAAGIGTNFKNRLNSPFYPTDRYTYSIHSIASVKGRIGYAYDNWLAYVSGGWANGKVDLTLEDNIAGIRSTFTEWARGWTASAGFDFKPVNYFSLGLSYDYFYFILNEERFNCSTCGVGTGLGTPTVDGHIATQAVMGHLTYHLG